MGAAGRPELVEGLRGEHGGEALIAFAVKANSNLAVLSVLAKQGAGADTVSEGKSAGRWWPESG